MDKKQDKLSQLRQRANVAIQNTVNLPDFAHKQIDELLHEIGVYHIELEIQLEDLQQAYQTIESAKQRYTNLFDFAPVGYLVTNSHGIILNANLTVEDMVGIDRQQLEKMPFADLITRDFQDIFHLYQRAVLNTHQAQLCDIQIRHADGKIIHVQLNITPHDIPNKTLRITLTNITAIKQTEQALRHALAHEEEINQLRVRVLSIISHEFRTPLATILLAVENLERYYDRMTPEKRQKHFQTIRNYVRYLNDTVDDATSLQKFSESIHLKPELFDVIEQMRQIISDTTSMIAEGREIILDITGQNPQEIVTWDMKLFRRMMMNLLHNACKYSQQSVVCQVECTDTLVKLSVKDYGMGISPEDQQHMYQPLYRGKNTEFISGTGIGLYVVYEIVQIYGGTIVCDSRLNEGTTFTVHLPRHTLLSAPDLSASIR